MSTKLSDLERRIRAIEAKTAEEPVKLFVAPSFTGSQFGQSIKIGDQTWAPHVTDGKVTKWVLIDDQNPVSGLEKIYSAEIVGGLLRRPAPSAVYSRECPEELSAKLRRSAEERSEKQPTEKQPFDDYDPRGHMAQAEQTAEAMLNARHEWGPCAVRSESEQRAWEKLREDVRALGGEIVFLEDAETATSPGPAFGHVIRDDPPLEVPPLESERAEERRLIRERDLGAPRTRHITDPPFADAPRGASDSYPPFEVDAYVRVAASGSSEGGWCHMIDSSRYPRWLESSKERRVVAFLDAVAVVRAAALLVNNDRNLAERFAADVNTAALESMVNARCPSPSAASSPEDADVPRYRYGLRTKD